MFLPRNLKFHCLVLAQLYSLSPLWSSLDCWNGLSCIYYYRAKSSNWVFVTFNIHVFTLQNNLVTINWITFTPLDGIKEPSKADALTSFYPTTERKVQPTSEQTQCCCLLWSSQCFGHELQCMTIGVGRTKDWRVIKGSGLVAQFCLHHNRVHITADAPSIHLSNPSSSFPHSWTRHRYIYTPPPDAVSHSWPGEGYPPVSDW